MGKSNAQLDFENTLLLARYWQQQNAIERCQDNLRAFVKEAWPVVEPGVPYVHGWHIDAICDHLSAVATGDIRKLLINIPPRCAKSTLCAILFPAWIWIKSPERRFLFSSYDLKLSMRDSRKCRSLLGSTWYQRPWANKFKILTNKGGQDTKQRFDNDKGGYRIATATDVGTTGDGGDIVCYDDLNNVKEMTSEAYIEGVIYFHEHVMPSRVNDPKTSCRISIQQRSHERDITGHILETEHGWDHLVIPMEFEGSTKTTSIGWSDPRVNAGELMWPERFGPTEIEPLKKNAIVWSGQYQQHPSPGEGAMFKREYWNFWNPPTAPRLADGSFAPVVIRAPGQPVIEKIPVEIPPAFEQVVQSWDMAFKDEADNDLVAGHAWGRIAANTYLFDRESDQWDFVKTVAAVRRLSVRVPCPEKLIEDKANGPAVISTLKNEIPGLIPVTPEGGKVSRANAVSPYCQSGNVYLPNPNLYPWVWEMIEQFANFPRGRHDDDVDAMTQALRRLYDAVANGSMPEFRVIPRKGEPATACHVKPDAELLAECPPHWRRWIAVSPGAQGAALWVCETPKGSLRVYRELDISGIDAHEAGRRIAEATLPDIRAFMSAVHATAKWNIDLLLEKEAFTPIEPIGSLAELLEMGLLSYEQTTGTFEEREAITAELRLAKFSAQMAEIEDGSIDRLRDLLRFKPVDFEELSYDRAKAISLARTDQAAYARFMAAIDGQVVGDFPKIRFAASCLHTIASVGAAKRDEEITDAFLRALVIGISAPPSVMTAKPMKEVPWHGNLRSRKPLGLLRRAG